MYMFYIWLAVIVIGLIVEFIDAGTLVSVWFSVGAVIPCFMGIYRTSAPWYIILQVLIFGVVTALCLIYLRKIAKKLLFRNDKETTNLDSFTGKKAKIYSLNEDKNAGLVKLNSVVYTSIAENEETKFKENEEVEIVKFVGNKIVVKKIH